MLTYFYSEVIVEKVSTYRKNNKKRNIWKNRLIKKE